VRFYAHKNWSIHVGITVNKTSNYTLYQQLKADPQTPPYYLRDQFQVGVWRVMVVEYFELLGPTAVRYKFLVHRGQAQSPEYTLSLGSYEITNEFARQRGQLQPGERLFHLDEYRPGRHAGLGFFKNEPPYDAIKAAVCKIIARGDSRSASEAGA
jgi:hypothetical protein